MQPGPPVGSRRQLNNRRAGGAAGGGELGNETAVPLVALTVAQPEEMLTAGPVYESSVANQPLPLDQTRPRSEVNPKVGLPAGRLEAVNGSRNSRRTGEVSRPRRGRRSALWRVTLRLVVGEDDDVRAEVVLVQLGREGC